MPVTDAVVLPRDLSAARHARSWITELLDPLSLPDTSIEEILLIASELVTNVVAHTTSAPRLRLDADAQGVRIEVADSSAEPARIREPVEDRPGGWGLLLVDSIADAWGMDRRDDGTKVVWFRLAVA